MDSLIHVAGWSQHHQPRSARPLGHFRSLSVAATPPSPPNKLRLPLKSPSTSQLPSASHDLSTLPDPRTQAGRCSPRLDELATLSTKLVNAINHQTLLDDSLSAARHELQAARDRIRELELLNQSQRDMLAGDVWVRRSALDVERKALQADNKALQARLAAETARRLDTDKEKRKIEQELENLTTALFEEANKMVIAAKEEAQAQHDALRRKIDQLKAQLADSESLLKSQQEQLSQLKNVMESMASEPSSAGTAPPSPAVACPDDDHGPSDGPRRPESAPESPRPCHPTALHHLIQPVLRTDLALYDDLTTLARLSQQRRGSRVSSASLGGLASLTIGLGGSTSSAHPSNASTTSLGAASSVPATSSSAPQSPNTPASTASASAPSLRDTRFYRRVLAEDIEPTLRLDTAPGLSWLARRSVLTSMTDGSLVVEPVPNNAAQPRHYPCALCGESRKSPEHLRNHRFRTSEADSAQRYPLCLYCLNRVRSTCDFLGFLRMLKDGHWRAADGDLDRAAWEESVRLREHMFWSRIGGGVVPVSAARERAGQDAAMDAAQPAEPTAEKPE